MPTTEMKRNAASVRSLWNEMKQHAVPEPTRMQWLSRQFGGHGGYSSEELAALVQPDYKPGTPVYIFPYVKGAPPEVNRILERVYRGEREKGRTKPQSGIIAWRAVRAAGYEPEMRPMKQWVKRRDYAMSYDLKEMARLAKQLASHAGLKRELKVRATPWLARLAKRLQPKASRARLTAGWKAFWTAHKGQHLIRFHPKLGAGIVGRLPSGRVSPLSKPRRLALDEITHAKLSELRLDPAHGPLYNSMFRHLAKQLKRSGVDRQARKMGYTRKPYATQQYLRTLNTIQKPFRTLLRHPKRMGRLLVLDMLRGAPSTALQGKLLPKARRSWLQERERFQRSLTRVFPRAKPVVVRSGNLSHMPERTGAVTLSKRRIVVSLPEAAGSRGVIRSWLAHEGVHAMAGQKLIPGLSTRVEPFDPRRGFISRLFGPRHGTPSERALFKSVRRKLQSEARKPYALPYSSRTVRRLMSQAAKDIKIRLPLWTQGMRKPGLAGQHTTIELLTKGKRSPVHVIRLNRFHTRKGAYKHLPRYPKGYQPRDTWWHELTHAKLSEVLGARGGKRTLSVAEAADHGPVFSSTRRHIVKQLKKSGTERRARKLGYALYMVSPTLVTSERGVRCLRPACLRTARRIRASKLRIQTDGCR